MKLTDSVVTRAELPEGSTDHVIWDSEVTGFGLRIRPGGKSYILAYRPAGAGRAANTKRLKLGAPDSIRTASEARTLARIALGRIAAGVDPLAERKAEKQREKARLGELLDSYELDLQRRRYVNRRFVIASLKTKMAPLLSREVRGISGAEIASIIEKLERDRLFGAAQDFRSRARAFFTWCVTKPKVLDANPLAGFRKERSTRADRIAKTEVSRALSDVELAKVWNAAAIDTAFGRLLRFLILTGCRRGEGAGLTWAMVDRPADVILLPPTFTKQGRGHVVPITPALAQLLDACTIDARSDLVFASPRTGGAMRGWSQLLARFWKRSGVEFHLHDLRRTFRTGLSRLGVDTETAELALGHARSDLEARYNKDAATGQLRKAFEAWAEHVVSQAC